jgi:hypothetical protein
MVCKAWRIADHLRASVVRAISELFLPPTTHVLSHNLPQPCCTVHLHGTTAPSDGPRDIYLAVSWPLLAIDLSPARPPVIPVMRWKPSA